MLICFFPDRPEIDMMLRMLFACLCGLIVGLERTRHQKAAGMRTYILVTLGATVFTLVSRYGFLDIVGDGRQVDVSRVASNIVTGVSFLGAGTIFMRGDKITGLTTAASIWAMAAIGTTLGNGMYIVAIVATVMLLTIQIMPQNYTFGHMHLEVKSLKKLVVCMDDSLDSLERLEQMMDDQRIDVYSSQIKRNKDESIVTYTYTVKIPEKADIVEIVTDISRIDSVRMIDL